MFISRRAFKSGLKYEKYKLNSIELKEENPIENEMIVKINKYFVN